MKKAFLSAGFSGERTEAVLSGELEKIPEVYLDAQAVSEKAADFFGVVSIVK